MVVIDSRHRRGRDQTLVELNVEQLAVKMSDAHQVV